MCAIGHSLSEHIAGCIFEYLHQCVGYSEPLPVDIDALHYIPIFVAFAGSFPVEEHLHQVQEVHPFYAVYIKLRMMGVIDIVMMKSWAQPIQGLFVFFAPVSGLRQLRGVDIKSFFLRAL